MCLRHKLNIFCPIGDEVCIFSVKVQALIRILRVYGVCEFVSQQLELVFFQCVASAAHFLFFEKIFEK